MLRIENNNNGVSAIAGALKAQDMTAQGNALGLESPCVSRPERAARFGSARPVHPAADMRSMDPRWGLILEETLVWPRRSADWQSAVSRIGNPLTIVVRHDLNLFRINHFHKAFLKRRTRSMNPQCSALSGLEVALTHSTQGVALGCHIPGLQPFKTRRHKCGTFTSGLADSALFAIRPTNPTFLTNVR